ncbi:hypothetical protein K503DRAFT_742079 [Rhizopogon vinicolor AM-OR11-026]|uniref:Uncharacterized protein n=1 Tax=Rhizopogon vinicolor AM-OR11-026 TaxID=1314800 RepID=A0A1B7MZ72_9AGAM|nr:hypothetical protein K503DRAFT_742079 [Rhizopogon vinicolor AM-OR11-026]
MAGAPPPYRFVNRVYGRSFRPVIFAFSMIGALWSLIWTITSFKELKVDDNGAYPKLAPLAIVQGVLYSIALAIEVFGIYSAASQRARVIRLYAFLCAIAGLLIVAVGFMRSITHFTYKTELISECTTLAQNGQVDTAFGVWATNPQPMNETNALSYCNDEWNRDSWSEIIATIFEIVLALLFTSVAFAYYRQIIDPSSPANALRAPSNQVRMDMFPPNYNPPYDPGYQPSYAPPTGPPPTDSKPPEYSYAGGDYLGREFDKDDKKEDDPFSDYEGPSIPRPLHFAEERDVTSRV